MSKNRKRKKTSFERKTHEKVYVTGDDSTDETRSKTGASCSPPSAEPDNNETEDPEKNSKKDSELPEEVDAQEGGQQ